MILPCLIFAAAVLPSPAMERTMCGEPRVELVSHGRARMKIVTADGTRERRAALYLAAALLERTGVKFDVFVETPKAPCTNAPAFRISTANDLDAFRVITKDGTIRFLGRSDFAVYDWCERVLASAERGPACAVEAVDYADWPVFAHRDVCRNSPWAQLEKVGGQHRVAPRVHAPHHWFEDPDVLTNHPNIFARQPDGSRGEMPLLCYGNPETLDYYKRRIDEHISGVRDSGGIVDTNRQVITVSHWDVPLDCTCDYCRRLMDPSRSVTGSGSPVIWGYFLRNLAAWAAAFHPEYTISFLPYLNVCDVPDGLDLSMLGNCEATVCAMPGLAMFKEPSVCAHEEALIVDWARATGRKVVIWHYGCWPREFTSAPYLFGRTIAKHYRRMAPFVIGTFNCGGDAMAADRISNYIWLKCLWNPAVDVEVIYDDLARRLFGPAAGPMRRLMTMQEDGWERHWDWPHCSMDNTFGISYPHEDVEEMKRLLCEAARLAKHDPRTAARVRWYAADFTQFFADEERYRAAITFEPLVLRRTADVPAVDGRLDDPCWKTSRVRNFIPAFGGGRQSRPTEVRSVWSDMGVFFAFRCVEPAWTNLNLSAAYGELKKQDTLEIFIDASGTKTGTCHRLMFDVRNRMSATASDASWAARGVNAVVKREMNAWCVEVFVPFASLTGPVSRTSWRGNFTRWHPEKGGMCERSRLSTLGSTWNQSRDAFTDWIFCDH